jgi:hypothetical protein
MAFRWRLALKATKLLRGSEMTEVVGTHSINWRGYKALLFSALGPTPYQYGQPPSDYFNHIMTSV